MKKYRFLFLSLAILLSFSVTACSGKTENMSSVIDELVPENITSVELGGGQYNGGWVEPRELSSTEIEDLNTWISQLSLSHKTFEKGNSPGDLAGGTGYTFNYNGDEISFTWVDIGTGKYIYYENEWYEITNTSDAPLDLPS